MRGAGRTDLDTMRPVLVLSVLFGLSAACVPGVEETLDPAEFKTSSLVRAGRRAYDGAPPVISHASLGASCDSCHARGGLVVRELGVAPASPHSETAGMALPRCEQCHVYQETAALWVDNSFRGLPQELLSGNRMYPGAPAVMPHPIFMREECLSCHGGTAAREEIRTTHPERTRCLQCHVEQRTVTTFPPS